MDNETTDIATIQQQVEPDDAPGTALIPAGGPNRELNNMESYQFGIMGNEGDATNGAPEWKRAKNSMLPAKNVYTGKQMKAMGARGQIVTAEDFIQINPMNFPLYETITIFRVLNGGDLEYFYSGSISNKSLVKVKEQKQSGALSGIFNQGGDAPAVTPRNEGTNKAVEMLGDMVAMTREDNNAQIMFLQQQLTAKDTRISELMTEIQRLQGEFAEAKTKHEQHVMLQGLRDDMRKENQSLKDQMAANDTVLGIIPKDQFGQAMTGFFANLPGIIQAAQSAFGNGATPAPPMPQQVQQQQQLPQQTNNGPMLRPMNGQSVNS